MIINFIQLFKSHLFSLTLRKNSTFLFKSNKKIAEIKITFYEFKLFNLDVCVISFYDSWVIWISILTLIYLCLFYEIYNDHHYDIFHHYDNDYLLDIFGTQ